MRPIRRLQAAPLYAAVALGVATFGVSRSAPAQVTLQHAESDRAPDERYHSPQHFAFQITFGPYRPDVDSEFSSSDQHPYADYFGTGRKLLTQAELDYQFFHRFGSLAVGLGVGYFKVSAPSPVADSMGELSGDRSALTVVPMSLSAVYRFDYYLRKREFPLVPYGKLGLDYAYWQITDGNDEIATDGRGGRGRGGTAGWHAALGIALVLDILDPDAALAFDADMGVNHTALTFEYGHYDISGLGSPNRMHVGDTTWTLGLLFEF